MTGRRLSDAEFVDVLIGDRSAMTWDLDPQGRYLLLPTTGYDGLWVQEGCEACAVGDFHVLGTGDAIVFQRADDFNFAQFLTI